MSTPRKPSNPSDTQQLGLVSASKELRAFRFTQPSNPGGFKMVVMATSIGEARDYVKKQGSSAAHRALRFLAEGHPSDPDMWCAALAKGSL
jgi:hypothetical protein